MLCMFPIFYVLGVKALLKITSQRQCSSVTCSSVTCLLCLVNTRLTVPTTPQRPVNCVLSAPFHLLCYCRPQFVTTGFGHEATMGAARLVLDAIKVCGGGRGCGGFAYCPVHVSQIGFVRPGLCSGSHVEPFQPMQPTCTVGLMRPAQVARVRRADVAVQKWPHIVNHAAHDPPIPYACLGLSPPQPPAPPLSPRHAPPHLPGRPAAPHLPGGWLRRPRVIQEVLHRGGQGPAPGVFSKGPWDVDNNGHGARGRQRGRAHTERHTSQEVEMGGD